MLHPIGFWGAGPTYPDVITLSGTSGAPNPAEVITTAPDPAFCEWEFRASGTVHNTEVGQFQDGVEWSDLQDSPTAGFHIKASVHSGTNPTDGDSIDTWLALSSNRSWGLTVTEFDDSCVLKIEISPNPSGAPVVATGYYEIAVEVGE